VLPWQILYGNFVRNIYERGGRTQIRKNHFWIRSLEGNKLRIRVNPDLPNCSSDVSGLYIGMIGCNGRSQKMSLALDKRVSVL
jgi:hypothetical protein